MFKNLKFSQKLMIVLGFTSFLIILVIGLTTYFMYKNDLEKRLDEELKQLNDFTYNLIETNIESAIKNFLKAISEQILRVAKRNYDLYQEGKLSEKDAYNRTKDYILDPYLVKIGKTGYQAGTNDRGILEIHPISPGRDGSKYEFMQKAIKQLNGYIEYEWQNFGEDKPKKKCGYMSYFKPWRLIMWPTAYEEDFYDLVDIEALRKKIKSIKLRDTGYMYVMDKNGKVLIHPTLEEETVIDYQDKNGKYFVREMMRKKNGRITYYWKDKQDKEWREKVVLYKHYEKLDWLICSGVYLDELYAPINKIAKTIIGISIIVLISVIILSIFLGRPISKPVELLAAGAKSIGEGNLDIRIPVTSKDEIGILAWEFNNMAGELSKAMQEVEKANQAKSRFLGNMSHEIRTPLTSIMGHTDLLIPQAKDQKMKESLEHIKVSTRTLKDFIDNTLYMSRLEKEKIIIRIEPMDFYAILNEIRENFAYSIQQKKLEYLEEVEPGVSQYLDLDKLRLKQVLINLVDNAIKYTDKGHVKLIVKKSPAATGTDSIDMIFAVEDSGIGIASEDLERLFKPFERLEDKQKKSTEGAGLGLSISRGIIQLMGGEIAVQSEVNKGTTFTFTLKNIRVSSQSEAITNGEEFDHTSTFFNRQAILIVDDKKDTRNIIKGYLEKTTLRVLEAEDGLQALKMAQEHKPSLILMDIKMPVMDGIQATCELRKDNHLKDIPIIALTASKTAPEDVEKYGHLFQLYLLKPLSRSRLFFELSQFLKEEPKDMENEIKIELAPGDREKIPPLITELETYLEIWETAGKSNNFNEFRNFGLKIKELGDKYSLPILSDYGGRIIHHAEMFAITDTKKILNAYPALIDKLKLI